MQKIKCGNSNYIFLICKKNISNKMWKNKMRKLKMWKNKMWKNKIIFS